MVYYAQTDDNGVVVGISQLGEKVDAPNMVQISEYDEGLLGGSYKNGEFTPQEHSPVKFDDTPPPDPIHAKLDGIVAILEKMTNTR